MNSLTTEAGFNNALGRYAKIVRPRLKIHGDHPDLCVTQNRAFERLDDRLASGLALDRWLARQIARRIPEIAADALVGLSH